MATPAPRPAPTLLATGDPLHAAAHQHLADIAHLRHRINTLLVRTDSP
ncbi:MAG: hypothetical protein ACRDRI_15780 [Pseudonocardiaceae bacterium]